MNPVRHELRVSGFNRHYLVVEPASAPTAVIVSLHGSRSQAVGQFRLSRIAQLAGVVAVFPQALTPIGSGYEWDHQTDLPFLHQLVNQLCDRYRVPGGRVCLTGMSGGARMVCHYASVHPDLVAMVGAVAGLRAPASLSLVRPVPILAFHGTADRINPYDGGATPRWSESVPEASRSWALANAITTEPEVVQVSTTLTRSTYGGCDGAGEVTLWTSRRAGHTWPGSRVAVLLAMMLGRTTTEIDATGEIYSFARAHALDR